MFYAMLCGVASIVTPIASFGSGRQPERSCSSAEFSALRRGLFTSSALALCDSLLAFAARTGRGGQPEERPATASFNALAQW